MRRLASAAALVAATVALAGCVFTPPSAPSPPTDTTQPPTTQPTTQPSSQPTQPTQTAAGGAPTGAVEGSTAVITNEGVTWRLQLLDFGPAPLDQLTAFGGDDGAPAPAPPAGMEVGWACMRGTLEAAPDDGAAVVDVVNQFTVPGGEDGWDYETADRELDLYGAAGSVGDVVDRFCAIVLVPQGFDYSALTTVTYDLVTNGDDLELVIPTP